MANGEEDKNNRVNNAQRTIKISAAAYQMLSHQSTGDKKPMEEIASAIICVALNTDQHVNGEQYDKKGNRIFRRAPV